MNMNRLAWPGGWGCLCSWCMVWTYCIGQYNQLNKVRKTSREKGLVSPSWEQNRYFVMPTVCCYSFPLLVLESMNKDLKSNNLVLYN
jgi:hypothetical protein